MILYYVNKEIQRTYIYLEEKQKKNMKKKLKVNLFFIPNNNKPNLIKFAKLLHKYLY